MNDPSQNLAYRSIIPIYPCHFPPTTPKTTDLRPLLRLAVDMTSEAVKPLGFDRTDLTSQVSELMKVMCM